MPVTEDQNIDLNENKERSFAASTQDDESVIRDNWAHFQPTESFQPSFAGTQPEEQPAQGDGQKAHAENLNLFAPPADSSEPVQKPADLLKELYPALAGDIDNGRQKGMSDEDIFMSLEDTCIEMMAEKGYTPEQLDKLLERTTETKQRAQDLMLEDKLSVLGKLTGLHRDEVAARIESAAYLGYAPSAFLLNEDLWNARKSAVEPWKNWFEALWMSYDAKQKQARFSEGYGVSSIASALAGKMGEPEKAEFLKAYDAMRGQTQRKRSANVFQTMAAATGDIGGLIARHVQKSLEWELPFAAAMVGYASMKTGSLGLTPFGAAAGAGGATLAAAKAGVGAVFDAMNASSAAALGSQAANYLTMMPLEGLDIFAEALRKGADPRLAALYATGGGFVNAIIERGLLSSAGKVLGRLAPRGMSKAFKETVISRAAGKVVKQAVKGLPVPAQIVLTQAFNLLPNTLSEALEEPAQGTVSKIAETGALVQSGKKSLEEGVSDIFSKETLQQAEAEFTEAGKEFFAAGVVPTVANMALSLLGYRTFKKSPQGQALARYEASLKNGGQSDAKGDARNVYISKDALQTFKQSLLDKQKSKAETVIAEQEAEGKEAAAEEHQTAAEGNATGELPAGGETAAAESGIEEQGGAEESMTGPSIEEQLGISDADLVESTGEYRIDREKFNAVAKANPVFANAVADHVRIGAFGMTAAEAAKKINGIVADPLNADNEYAQSARKVYEEALAGLKEIGKSDEEAEASARIYAKYLLARSISHSNRLSPEGLPMRKKVLAEDLHKLEVRKFEEQQNRTAQQAAAEDIAQTNSGVFMQDLLKPSDYDEDGSVRPDVVQEIKNELAIIRSEAEKNGTYLKAPNGNDSNLPAGVWEMVRTRRFREWFGNSQVLDENGEPKIVYHGTVQAGFTQFDTEGAGKTEGAGAFFSDRKKIAGTYAGGVENTLAPEYDESGNLVVDEYDEKLPLDSEHYIYPVFLKMEHPYIVDAQGKNWDNVGEITITDMDYSDAIYSKADGTPFMNEDEAWDYIEKELDDPEHQNYQVSLSGEMTTDEIARAVYKGYQGDDYVDGHSFPYDGVIFQNVADEGPAGSGYGWESTVYSVPTPEQIKSVDNRGTFDAGENIFYQDQSEIRYKEKLKRDSIAWAKAVDKFLIGEMKPTDIVRVMDMPLALELAGAPVREIATDYNFFDHTVAGKHSKQIIPSLMKKLVRSMADPIMVYDSASHPGTSLVVMLELTDNQGATVVAPVRLQMDPSDPNSPAKLTSFYGKGDPQTGTPNNKWFIKQVVDKNGNLTGRLKYVNRKKLSRWSSVYRLQLPQALAPSRLPSSISTEADLVKYRKFNGNQFYQSAWHGTPHRFERYNQIIGEQGAGRLSNAEQVRADLTTAREMETAGKNFDIIRLATGWERGADGKWRYELQDGEMTPLSVLAEREAQIRTEEAEHGKTLGKIAQQINEARQLKRAIHYLSLDDRPERWAGKDAAALKVYKEAQALIKQKGAEAAAAEIESQIANLKRRYDDESEAHSFFSGHKLEDVYASDELYKAYPQLRNMRVVFADLQGRAWGLQHPGQNLIEIEKSLSDAQARSTLIHEIQHEIQDIEGFSRGADQESAWRALSKNLDEARDEMTHFLEQHDLVEYDRIDRALWTLQGEENREKRAELFERFKMLGEHIPDEVIREYEHRQNRIDRLEDALSRRQADPWGAYTLVAGEVEADVAGKSANLSKEERRKKSLRSRERARRWEQVFIGGHEAGPAYSAQENSEAPLSAEPRRSYTKEEVDSFVEKIVNREIEEIPVDQNIVTKLGKATPEALLSEAGKMVESYKGKSLVDPLGNEVYFEPGNTEDPETYALHLIAGKEAAVQHDLSKVRDKRVYGLLVAPLTIEKPVAITRQDNGRKLYLGLYQYGDYGLSNGLVIGVEEGQDGRVITAFVGVGEKRDKRAATALIKKHLLNAQEVLYLRGGLSPYQRPPTDQHRASADTSPSMSGKQSIAQVSNERNTQAANAQLRTDDVAEESLPYLQDRNDQQQARGSIQIGPNGEGIITLFKDADRSTFFHELGHLFLDNLITDALSGVSERTQKDLDTVRKYLGIEDLDLSKRHMFTGEEQARYTEAQERFARSWEAYLMEGAAPTPEMRGIFARLKRWLIDIYKDVVALDVELSDDVRNVFDHLLMTEDEIEAAETTVEQLAAVDDMTDDRIGELEKEIKPLSRVMSAQWDSVGLDEANMPAWVTHELIDGMGDALAEGRPALVKAIRKLGGIRYDSVAATWGEGEAKELRARDRSLFRKDGAAFDTLVAELEHEGIHVNDAQDLYDRLMAQEPKITKGLNVAITEETLPWLFYLMDDGEVRDYAASRQRLLNRELKALQDADDHTELRSRGPEIAKEQDLIREILDTIKKPQQQKAEVSESDDSAFVGGDADLSFGPPQGDAVHESIQTQEAADRAAGLLRDDELISLKEADRRAWRRAARESRRAYFAGRQTGAAQVRAKVAALKEAQRKRKAERDEINKAVKFMKKALVDKQMSWTMQQKIKAKLDEYTLSRPNKNRLASARELLDYIEQTPDAELSQFAPSDQRYVKMLETTTLNDMTLADVRALRQEIEAMALEGREQFDRWANEREARRQTAFSELMAALGDGAVPQNEVKTIVAPADLEKQYKGLKGKLVKAKDWTLANTMGANRFFDWLGGGKGDYKSVWTRYFVDRINEALDDELRHSQSRYEQMEQLMSSLGLSFEGMNELRNVDGQFYSVDQLIHIYAGLKNEASRKAITYGNMRLRLMRDGESGVQEHIAHCVSALSDAERQLGDAVIADFNVHFDRINNALIDAFNQGMKHEENYTPMARLEYSAQALNNILNIDENQMIEGEASMKGTRNTSVEKGFLEERMEIDDEHQQPIKLGLLSLWHDQVHVQEHTAAYGKLAGDLRSMLMKRDEHGVTIGRRVVDVFGRDALAYLREYTNIAIQGQVITASTVLDGMYAYLGRNMAIAYLTLNFGTMLKQFTSLPRFIVTAGPVYLANAMGQFLMSQRKGKNLLLDEIYKLDPQMKNRAPDVFLQVLKDARQSGKVKSSYMRMLEKMMAPISVMDRTVSAIGWWATYQRGLKNGLSKAEAVREAQRAVALTQQTPLAKDMPRVWNQNGMMRLMMIFTSDMANTWGMSIYDLTHSATGRDRLMTVAALASTALLMGMVSGGPDDDDEFIAWYMKQLMEQQVGAAPIIGKEVMSAIDAMSGRFGRSSYSALTAPLVKIMQGSSGVFADDADKIYPDGTTKRERSFYTALEGLSLLVPFPFTTLNRIRRALNSDDGGEAARIMLGMRLRRRNR